MADPVPFDWRSLIPHGISAGVGLLGQRMASGPAREQNAWQRAMVESEMRRRNMLQGYAAPSMLHALGYRDPKDIADRTAAISGPAPGMGSTWNNSAVPQTPTSGASTALSIAGKGLGAAGTAGSLGLLGSLAPATKVGLGITTSAAGAGGVPGALGLGGGAGLLGLGAATIPVLGGLIAGGAYAANKIGQGRRTANQATQGEGFENQFVGTLQRAAQGQATAQELAAARQTYEQNAQAWMAQGGQHARVAQQSLANRDLQQTYNTLIGQLGRG